MITEATALPVPRCALGESPRWAHGRWWWVDAGSGRVWSGSPALLGAEQDGTEHDVRLEFEEDARVPLVHPAHGGKMVLVRNHDVLVLDPDTGTTRLWTSIDLAPDWSLNDGTADIHGRLWIGSIHPERASSGGMHRVDSDGSVTSTTTGTQLSNGMVWTPDGTLLHADSLARTILEYDTDPDHGTLSPPRQALPLPHEDRLALPDGIALDVEGGLWVAIYGAGEARRFVNGHQVETITVPTPQVTAVALGGPDGRDLLITTAQEGMDELAIANDTNAGALFRARTAVPGEPVSLVDLGEDRDDGHAR